MTNIREFIGFKNSYFAINREERNLAAIFYHTLLLKNNLQKFLNLIACDFTVDEKEFGIYFEYAYLRDLWYNIKGRNIDEINDNKRELIYTFLKPYNVDELKKYDTGQFNSYFGAVSRSPGYIESPGNWSIDNYKRNIPDDQHQEFLKICKFKWSFNAKPDIVIHTSNNHAVCIEAKLESTEGFYPTKQKETEEFKRRGLEKVSQTTLQTKIMELLGIQTKFIFLIQKGNPSNTSFQTIVWKDVFSILDVESCPYFIKEWIKRLATQL
jgi:hypothetical protein